MSGETSNQARPASSTSKILGKWRTYNVPAALLDLPILNDVIFVDVLNAGPRAGLGLTDQQAREEGKIKNHWSLRLLIPGELDEDGELEVWQVQIAMNIKSIPSVGSLQPVIGSKRGSFSGDSKGVYSAPASSIVTPPDLSHNGSGSARSREGDVSDQDLQYNSQAGLPSAGAISDTQSAVYSDPGDQRRPPSIKPSDNPQFFIDSHRHLGQLDIKVRDRSDGSLATIVSFRLAIRPCTTVGEFLESINSHHMDPFWFKKVYSWYVGCRDFISQVVAILLEQGILTSGICTELSPETHIYELLRWRYTGPLTTANLSDSRRQPNPLDRGIFGHPDFVRIEDDRLLYN